ncbi:MAG: hypothetical protein JWO11_4469 [Nocardioides sp.]|nr:hypothetical protein [Nocardioides sp.]
MAGLFRSRGSDRTPIRVETITPPAELPAMHDSALLDLTDRAVSAVRLIDLQLRQERARPRGLRNEELVNALLDVRNALSPGSQMLPLRPSVPVIPGRT